MSEKELTTVAKIRDSHGLKGELFIMSLAGDFPWLEGLTEFWLSYKALDKEGKHLPLQKKFTIKSTRPHKKGFLVMTNEIGDRTEADTYKGGQFLVPSELTVSKVGEEIFLGEIEGFEVSTEEGVLGTIDSFGSNGVQDLIQIKKDEKEYQIPFVKDFIVKIDFKKKTILMKLPEGLFE